MEDARLCLLERQNLELRMRLSRLESLVEDFAAWKAEQSKPVVVTIDPAAFDDSPRARQVAARALVAEALETK